jgi:hypothetical protein
LAKVTSLFALSCQTSNIRRRTSAPTSSQSRCALKDRIHTHLLTGGACYLPLSRRSSADSVIICWRRGRKFEPKFWWNEAPGKVVVRLLGVRNKHLELFSMHTLYTQCYLEVLHSCWWVPCLSLVQDGKTPRVHPSVIVGTLIIYTEQVTIWGCETCQKSIVVNEANRARTPSEIEHPSSSGVGLPVPRLTESIPDL